MTDINQNTAADNNPPKQHWAVRTTHWVVNFLGIGLILNGIISVKLLQGLQTHKPEYLAKFAKLTEQGLTKAVEVLHYTPRRVDTISKVSKHFSEICTLAIGGFLVVPFQKIYAAHRVHISDWVEKLFIKKDASDKENGASRSHPKESVESWSHWWAGRFLAFVAGAAVFMGTIYAAPEAYARVNKKLTDTLTKYLPKFLAPTPKTTEYCMAEYIATVTAVSTLALAKDKLDKMFPPKTHEPKNLASETLKKRDRLAEDSPKTFRQRVETQTPPASQPSL